MPRKFHSTYKFSLMALLLPMVVFAAAMAEARIFGEVELGYTTYDMEVNGVKRDARSFLQRYSLLYENGGRLAEGRLGRYKYSLGYEWGSVDARVKSPGEELDSSVSTGHVLFNGELIIEPKALPVRFKAYSRDMNRISFQHDAVTGLNSGDNVIVPYFADNMLNGTRISSGATLWLGLKNDLRAADSAIFNNIPMFLADYRDEYIRDMKSLTPRNSRLKQLAFVSLNKRDNWLHYRVTRYDDYINPTESYKEDRYMLGTVDHRLERRWVDLTNWIKISADGSFTKRQAQDTQGGDSQTYDLNLFAIASRERWEARTFNNFNRTRDVREIKSVATIPLYLQGVWGTETDWQVRLLSEDEKDVLPGNLRYDRSDRLASVRLNTFKRSLFTLSPLVSVEQVEVNTVKTVALEGNIETASTRRFSDTYGLFAGYNVKVFNYYNSTNSNFTEQTATGRGIWKPSEKIRLELEEKASIASGKRNEVADTTISPVQNYLSTSTTYSVSPRAETTGGYVRSVTTLRAAWTPQARLRIGFTASEDVLKQNGVDADIMTSLSNTIDYSLPTFSIGSNIRYVKRTAPDVDSSDITATGMARYTPNRNMEADLHYTYSQVKEGGQVSSNVDLVQRFKYAFTRTNGVARRLLDLTEELSYVKSNGRWFIGQFDTRKRLTLGATYYPTKNFFVSATARYSLLEPGNGKEWMGSGAAGAVFNKLQASVDYSYGRRESSTDNRIEKRFSANVKKQF